MQSNSTTILMSSEHVGDKPIRGGEQPVAPYLQENVPALYESLCRRGGIFGSFAFGSPEGVCFTYPNGFIMTQADFAALLPDIMRFYSSVTEAQIEDCNQQILERHEQERCQVPDALNTQQPHRSCPIRPGYVYLLKSAHGFYKIGRAESPEHRVGTLGVQLPFEITPEHFIKCEDMVSAEKMLHDMFSELRQRGEWFRLDKVDVAYIKAIVTISAKGEFNE